MAAEENPHAFKLIRERGQHLLGDGEAARVAVQKCVKVVRQPRQGAVGRGPQAAGAVRGQVRVGQVTQRRVGRQRLFLKHADQGCFLARDSATALWAVS